MAAFVLKYRLGREENSPYKIEEHPREDAYRALRTVRSRARDWGVDPARIGVMGFSAGGEVAALVAYDPGEPAAGVTDPIDSVNGRPNFQILVYPGPLCSSLAPCHPTRLRPSWSRRTRARAWSTTRRSRGPVGA